MKILVTGGAGFIGSNLCESLIKENQIFCLDNFCNYYNPEIKRNNIKNILNDGNFTLCEGDIRDSDFLNRIFSDNRIDIVIHLAGMAGVRPSIENPEYYADVNINGTIKILEVMKKYDVKNLIFASTSSIYGNNKKIPFSESDNVDFPISPYASTKKACELIIHNYYHLYGVSSTILRFFTVYGPRQRPDLAIHKFTDLISSGKEITVFGDGSTSRDYTFIEDIVSGITSAVEYNRSKCSYDVINLGNNSPVKLTEMIQTIEDSLGIKAKKKYMEMQPGDVDITYADITKAENKLNYKPTTSFEEGIRRFTLWYKQKSNLEEK